MHITVKTLETISQKLQNSFWNISQSSCQDGGSSFYKHFTDDILSNVTCNCTFANNTCHVTNMYNIIALKLFSLNSTAKTWQINQINVWFIPFLCLFHLLFFFFCECWFDSVMKGLNLTGVLPDEFGKLTHLQELWVIRILLVGYLDGTYKVLVFLQIHPSSFIQCELLIWMNINNCEYKNFVPIFKVLQNGALLSNDHPTMTKIKPFLINSDLTRNYINGSIPASISGAPLQIL